MILSFNWYGFTKIIAVLKFYNTLSIPAKSTETEEHAWRSQQTALVVGAGIGLPASELDRLSLVVTLHDIGKINIPEEILVKPGPLTDEEQAIMKTHSEKGYRLISAIEEFAHTAQEVLYHHERWDGTGYPEGLKGEEISLLSRIIAIVDAYDAMTNRMPYNPNPKSPEEAVSELKRCAGSQFDPKLTEVFVSLFEKGQIF